MATKDIKPVRKVRLTNEDITEIKRLHREGKSITAIAKEIGCHRQTVRLNLKEKHGDIIADEVRKQVLTEELRSHFRQLVEFAQVDLRSRRDASSPDIERIKPGESRGKGPIMLDGLLGLPSRGGAIYKANEWRRMYNPAPRDNHLLQALREHTLDSTLWIHWDNWRRKVKDYEMSTRALYVWLVDTKEAELYKRVNPTKIDAIQQWLMGNILLVTSGEKRESLDIFREGILDPKGVIIMRSSETDKQDADGSVATYNYLCGILNGAQKRGEWSKLRSATAALKQPENQLELRQIAKDIDYALASIELMHAFPGRCHLCPVY